MVLDQSLRLEASLNSGSSDVVVMFMDYVDIADRPSDPQPLRSALSSSAETIILAMPSGAVQFRELVDATIHNTHSAAVIVTVATDDGTTERIVYQESLDAGKTLQFMKGVGWFKNA